MVQLNKNIDTYIEQAKPFAQPILKHLRKLVHETCPEVEETIKWGFPHFVYRGILCCMASFQSHCAFIFWKSSLMKDPHQIMDKKRKNAMGQFGRITSLKDLPSDRILIAYIKEAMQLNDAGVKLPKRSAAKKKLTIPADFRAALEKNKKAWKVFEDFSYSQKKDYVEWITEAKQQTTRKKRMETAIEWISEGKTRNWKYE